MSQRQTPADSSSAVPRIWCLLYIEQTLDDELFDLCGYFVSRYISFAGLITHAKFWTRKCLMQYYSWTHFVFGVLGAWCSAYSAETAERVHLTLIYLELKIRKAIARLCVWCAKTKCITGTVGGIIFAQRGARKSINKTPSVGDEIKLCVIDVYLYIFNWNKE